MVWEPVGMCGLGTCRYMYVWFRNLIGGGRSINLGGGGRKSGDHEYKTGGTLNLFLVADFFLLQLNAARFQNSKRPRYRLLNACRKLLHISFT